MLNNDVVEGWTVENEEGIVENDTSRKIILIIEIAIKEKMILIIEIIEVIKTYFILCK